MQGRLPQSDGRFFLPLEAEEALADAVKRQELSFQAHVRFNRVSFEMPNCFFPFHCQFTLPIVVLLDPSLEPNTYALCLARFRVWPVHCCVDSLSVLKGHV